jgi:hypothetical protein
MTRMGRRICFCLGYLQITGLQVALLLNFKEARLQWKRVTDARTRSIEQSMADPGPLET